MKERKEMMIKRKKTMKSSAKKQEKIAEIARQYNSQMETVKAPESIKLEQGMPVKSRDISSFMPTTPAPKPGAKPAAPKPLVSPKPLIVATGFKNEDEDEMAKREEARLLRAFARKK